ncbi:hypothetical protein FA13DRAFT_1733222 [Coprinellus micaceus]|uniref:Uncharacterized protein n=1 Tax=Coprinellus micaceus TaxID=71717 RepID=A0A4Y7T9K5_COPMI|nr:hypothetical protein FA13DRAFT_1733222 [Coprinellus micaceus]
MSRSGYKGVVRHDSGALVAFIARGSLGWEQARTEGASMRTGFVKLNPSQRGSSHV